MFIVSNKIVGEIRVSNVELEGRVIYKGHKLGIPDKLLSKIINYKFERVNNSYYFLDYKKWKDIYNLEKLDIRMTQCWYKEVDTKRALLKSYNTLLESLTELVGEFRNIYIVEM